MLALLGFLAIAGVLAAILSRRASPVVALIGFPLVAVLLAGQGGQAGKFMLAGISTVAPLAAMFLFAILFFGTLADAGLFRPLVGLVARTCRGRPSRVAVGTAVLTSILHLDGSGASTFVIVIPALVPIYDGLGIDRRVLACVAAMAAGVGNMLPWGGPTLRAAASIEMPVVELFNPLLPVYAVGVLSVLFLSWWLGKRAGAGEHANDAAITPDAARHGGAPDGTAHPVSARYWFNLLLVIVVIAALFLEWLPPAAAFMVGLIVALTVNFPGLDAQRRLVEQHAPAAVTMVAVLFAAGAFTGLMRESGMLSAVAQTGADLVPGAAADAMPLIVAVLAMPLSLLFDPDSFYFGVLPILGQVAELHGTPAVHVARAALLGQMTTGFPVSPMTPATFLLIGLARIDLAAHQRFTIPYLYLLSIIMAACAFALGVISL